MANSFSMDDASAILKSVIKRDVRRFALINQEENVSQVSISVIVPADDSLRFVCELRALLLGSGLQVFAQPMDWAEGKYARDHQIIVCRGDTQYQILHVVKTQALDFTLDTNDFIQWLQKLDRYYGIGIYLADTRMIGFFLKKRPKDANSLAFNIRKFCLEIVDRNYLMPTSLAYSIRLRGFVYLRWDCK